MIELSVFQWSLAVLAAFILGCAKAGLKGLTVVIVTMMALVFGAKSSTGILLILLVVGDISAVIYYKKHVNWNLFLRVVPSMVAGVLIGVWLGGLMSETVFKYGLATLIFISLFMMLWLDMKSDKKVPESKFLAYGMGLVAGFATMIGNLAGAFVNVFFLSMRIPKQTFIGTAAWIFFVINLFKIPFHIFSWKTIQAETLQINLVLIPAVLLGFWVGLKIVNLFSEKGYRRFVIVMTFIGAVAIFFK